MAFDRLVYFHGTPIPPKDDLRKALEDYLGEIAISVKWERDRFFAHLIGKGSNPFQRIRDAYIVPEETERWIEVHIGGDNIDVITRRQDELTNNIANGFAKLVARYWQGSYTPEGGD